MSSDELLTDKWLKKLDRQSQTILDRVVFNRKTFGEVFDKQTILRLGTLISNKVINQVDFPLSSGKEANIFRGTTPEKGVRCDKNLPHVNNDLQTHRFLY